MKNSVEIYQEYLQEAKQDSSISYEAEVEYIRNSTAKYHGRCVRTCYLPKVFTQTEVEKFREIIKVLYGIFDKVIAEYRRNPEYRKLFGFEKELEELILRKPLYPCNLPMARIDLFYREDTGEFKFCEFNTDGASAMNEDRELNIAVKKTDAYQKMAGRYSCTSFELFDSWAKTVGEIYAQYEKKKEHPHIAIVDFMEYATVNEFTEFQKAFERAGYTAEICEIQELRYEDGKLLSPQGKQIDLVYRRAVTSDIMKNKEKIRPFLQAVKEDAVCLLGDFLTQIVHNKILFQVLYHDLTKKLLTDEELSFVDGHIPKTYHKKDMPDFPERLLQNKNGWILKPEDSYGSQGVYAGVEYDGEEWEKIVRKLPYEHYIIQEFYLPYQQENIELVDGEMKTGKYFHLTGLFVYAGKMQGIYSRVSRTEIISTQYSEMSLPTVIFGE